jgi:hypothetical protein
VIAFGYLYGYFVGPSKLAYAGTILLVAWPWALPQVFIVVSVIWFVAEQIKSLDRKRRLGVERTRPEHLMIWRKALGLLTIHDTDGGIWCEPV